MWEPPPRDSIPPAIGETTPVTGSTNASEDQHSEVVAPSNTEAAGTSAEPSTARTSSVSAVDANEFANCAAIEDSLRRLTCFDDLTKGAAETITALKPEEAFATLRELARSEFRPSVGARELFLDGCTLVDVSFEGNRAKNAQISKNSSNRELWTFPNDVNLYSPILFNVLQVDLTGIELDQFYLRPDKYSNLVMKRGQTANWARGGVTLSITWLDSKAQASALSDRTREIITKMMAPKSNATWEAMTSREGVFFDITLDF